MLAQNTVANENDPWLFPKCLQTSQHLSYQQLNCREGEREDF